MKKFGVKTPFQAQIIKQKIKDTNYKKYGVENPTQHPRFKRFEKRTIESVAKALETNTDRYGALTYSSTPERKTRIKRSLFEKNYLSWDLYEHELKKRYLTIITNHDDFFSSPSNKFKCDIDGHEWNSENTIPRCPLCEVTHRFSRSNLESSFFSFLDELSINYVKNKRFDSCYELDVFIEECSIGIELNGLYWHSEKNGKDKKYHINKLKFFNERGIRLIQIFEDEWVFSRSILEGKVKKILNVVDSNVKKIHARKCIIKNLRYRDCIDFLNENHIQGASPSSINLGAYFNNELISVMTFSKNRLATGFSDIVNNDFELVRFSVKNNVVVTGIFGKFIKFFTREHLVDKIISYADKRFTDRNNNIYTKNNFILTGESPPSYWYVKGYKREHRLKHRKQNLIKAGFCPTHTEKEIMDSRGYNRIWDCGQFKFEMVFN
jgi:hypothetical protein